MHTIFISLAILGTLLLAMTIIRSGLIAANAIFVKQINPRDDLKFDQLKITLLIGLALIAPYFIHSLL